MGDIIDFSWKVLTDGGDKSSGTIQFFEFEWNKQPDDYLNLYTMDEDGYLSNTLIGSMFNGAMLRLSLVDDPEEFLIISNPQLLWYGPPIIGEANNPFLIIKKDGMEIALDLNGIQQFEFTVREEPKSGVTYKILYNK